MERKCGGKKEGFNFLEDMQDISKKTFYTRILIAHGSIV
jgi:hypothetical protein